MVQRLEHPFSLTTIPPIRTRLIAFLMVLSGIVSVSALTRYVATSGTDEGHGGADKPWRTLSYAVGNVADGDTILVAAGSYAGGITIRNRSITIRGAQSGAVTIASPTTTTPNNCIYIGKDASGCSLVNLDIRGGYYYAIATESNWDSGDSLQYGAQKLTIDSCKVHDSGRDCIKLTPGSDNATIRRSEIYNSGMRDGSNAEGIDNVNADSMLVQDCYIHTIATNGVYPKGGAIGCIIERCRFDDIAHSAIVLGQNTDWPYFDELVNPQRYESIDCIARNNIITNCNGAGIQFEASLRPQAYNNTLVNVARTSRGAIQILGTDHYPPPTYDTPIFIASRDVRIVNNVVVLSTPGRPALFIVADGTNHGVEGTVTIDYNRYFHTGGALVFWDERSNNYTLSFSQWQTLLNADMHSSVGDPGLTPTHKLSSTSPCIDAGQTLAVVADDIDRESRLPGSFDIGADEYRDPAYTHSRIVRTTRMDSHTQTVLAIHHGQWHYAYPHATFVNIAGRKIGAGASPSQRVSSGLFVKNPRR